MFCLRRMSVTLKSALLASEGVVKVKGVLRGSVVTVCSVASIS